MNMQMRRGQAPFDHLLAHRPDHPVLYFAPDVLRATYARFRDGFPGLVTYAVKANPDAAVLGTLAGAGMGAFDVASLEEIARVRAVCPTASLHYNNPVRAVSEITGALDHGVRSFSVDRQGELDKLIAACPAGETELTVRFKLPVSGAVYDFGAKFGAEPDEAAALMQRAAKAGFTVSLKFHPGTQCARPAPWADYIAAAGRIVRAAGVAPARLNVGGGFPSRRGAEAPDLAPYFVTIREAVAEAFPERAPALLCEPGRGMVGDCITLAARIKARDGDTVFLNDGMYGALAEFADIGAVERISVPGRRAAPRPFRAFGPTCDSIDMLPAPLALPGDVAEGDYVLFAGMGAYTGALATRFNGYGAAELVEVARL